MRDKNVFGVARALPRMSWSPQNLFNLWSRSLGPTKRETDFDKTYIRIFKQRWISKRLVRAYHGDYISEKIFKRWYLPATLPDVRPRKTSVGDDSVSLIKWAKRQSDADRLQKQIEQEARAALAPVGSLMFTEVERRIDVFLFRCCFAHSVYEARRLVIHGSVKLNGKEHTNANTRLAPGDMVSVDPAAIRFLQPQKDILSESGQTSEQSSQESNSEETSVELETFSGSEVADKVGPGEAKVENIDARPKKKSREALTPFILPDYAAPFIFIPAYIEVSFPTCSAVYVRHPTARPGYSEVPTPYDADGDVVRLAWEWYAKRRPRMRSRSQLESMPENRHSAD